MPRKSTVRLNKRVVDGLAVERGDRVMRDAAIAVLREIWQRRPRLNRRAVGRSAVSASL